MTGSVWGCHGYKIHRNYSKLTIWNFDSIFHELVGISTTTPDKGLTRRQRYQVIAKRLEKIFNHTPDYKETYETYHDR